MIMLSNKKRLITLVGLSTILYLLSCTIDENKSQKIKRPDPNDRGLQLAQNYCSGCHAFPKAEILPTTYWGRLMPIMGFFLGAGKEKFKFADYMDPIAKERLSNSGLFPEESIIDIQDWIEINKYYLNFSPRELVVDDTPDFDMNLTQFTAEELPWKNSNEVEGLSYIDFVNDQFEVGLYNENESNFIKLDNEGNEIEKTSLPSPLADVKKSEKGELILLMGKLNNIDVPTGRLILKQDSLEELIAPLERPINFEIADFNNDGQDEILVAEFGKFLGGINLYSVTDSLEKINIHPHSGALKIILKDVNNDGLQDFYVLVAQADESVYLFTNQGDLKFEAKRVIRLPAHYGTTHFDLVDFDGDGDDDIICSSGDSGDYGIILKPFHGVRIFENQGNHQYKQAWFFPQQGAYGTVSADYDDDGDVDFASIGYFATYLNRDREVFIYFENISTQEDKWQFIPHGFRGKKDDCWILINQADVDNDGDIDIILGANSKVLHPEKKAEKLDQWQKHGGILTVLKNKLVE